ncbi:hypothetical protein L5515_001503 [Caenorhabditis briggsae]|uniref:Uncharacterized protein n=2 Tax=Caenorhabditis briggsae TaxID=6238 RepID=A0AAE9DWK6_CAEBR|nr:hypothetical protein L3Y34_015426 [Caenorhabditis briggsae]UMM13017.1 hypothetical protein L5515_001503 [Caenorhabditis briggsae]
MPTMVMSQLPKITADTSIRKRQKTKSDNIMAISYMYVGNPKKKSEFFVRERLVYRPSVEVTYEDVFSYLSSITSDDTISLHYSVSVNGLYVPITTTGQLHTFLRHVHNDPTVFLYVESLQNQEYVWNVTPQSNTHKMEKRVPAGGAAPAESAGDPYDSMEDEDEEEGEELSEDDRSHQDEDVDEGEYTDEERLAPILTDPAAPVVFGEKIPVKEAFVDPRRRMISQGRHHGSAEEPQELKNGGCPEVGSPKKNAPDVKKPAPRLPSKRWTTADAFNQVKAVLSDGITTGKMGSAPEQVAELVVLNVWNPKFPLDVQVLKNTVALLKHSIGTGIVCYYNQLMERSDSSLAKKNDMPVDKMPLDKMNHDDEFLSQFVNSAIIAAIDMLESVQHLAHLQNEFDYFDKLNQTASEKNFAQEHLPSARELEEHLRVAVSSAHYGFNIPSPLFVSPCECKEAIRLVTCELQKLLCAMRTNNKKTSTSLDIQEMLLFIIESAHKIIQRFTKKVCPEHKTIELAYRDSEEKKWEKDSVTHDKWIKLGLVGESRLNIPLYCFDLPVEQPPPFTMKPDDGSQTAVSQNNSTNGCESSTLQAVLPDSESPPQNLAGAETTLPAIEKLSTNDPEEVKNSGQPQSNAAAPAVKPSTTNTNTSTTTTSTGEAAGGGTATISKKMSPELQAMVDKMFKNVQTPHNFVYPPQPKPGAILIPTGGLARCRCSKNCPEFLMEPAYEYMERFNEPRQTVWEKTKQKRFKKN